MPPGDSPQPPDLVTKNTQRLAYGDPMRIIAIGAVLLIHAADPPVFQYEHAPRLTWWVCNTIKSACLWAVPVFIMLSGALLLNPARHEPANTFYRKRAHRVAVPLVFWTLFYLAWLKYYRGRDLDLAYAIKRVLSGTPYMHLYFMFVLAGLYAFTPPIRHVTRHTNSKQITALAAGVLTVATASSLIQCASGYPSYLHRNAFSSFVPYLGYYLMGYALRNTTLTTRQLAWAAAAFIATTAATAAASGYLAATAGRPLALAFYEYLSPFCVGQSVAAYLLIANLTRHIKPTKTLAYLASLTFGVYLVHPIFLDILYNHGITGGRPQFWVDLPTRFAAALLAGTALTAAIQRVPLLRRTVG